MKYTIEIIKSYTETIEANSEDEAVDIAYKNFENEPTEIFIEQED